jgi:hypothetical protein
MRRMPGAYLACVPLCVFWEFVAENKKQVFRGILFSKSKSSAETSSFLTQLKSN